MNWVETTDDTVLGSPHYIAPEILLDAGWTAGEMEVASLIENNKSCEKCGVKNYRHVPTNYGSVSCPLV